MAQKKAIGMQTFPIRVFRNTVTTAADGTPVYDPIDLDLQYENNEAFLMKKLEMIISNSSAIDAAPAVGVQRIRAALLDDPNASIDIATASEFDTRPEIVAFTEAVWSFRENTAAGNQLEKTSHHYLLDFPDGGIYVGRNLQYTLVFDETASIFGLAWELRAQLWGRKVRVSDAMFKQLMYGIRF